MQICAKIYENIARLRLAEISINLYELNGNVVIFHMNHTWEIEHFLVLLFVPHPSIALVPSVFPDTAVNC